MTHLEDQMYQALKSAQLLLDAWNDGEIDHIRDPIEAALQAFEDTKSDPHREIGGEG